MPFADGRIDVHFHLVPPFYRDAVKAGGLAPTISSGFPKWTPELSIEVMDRNGIGSAITSISQPGVNFGDNKKAVALARQCNEYAAELIARWPKRFGGFATVPLPDVGTACDAIIHALDVLRLDGVCLLASYGEKFLGAPEFDPVLDLLNQRGAAVFIHPNYHPSSRSLSLKLPGFVMEFPFDTTRMAVNLIFSGTLDRYPRIRFILAHAGGTLPYIAWRLSMSPLIDPRLPLSPEQVLTKLRHFWYDTAISAGRSTFGALQEIADMKQIVFGTDWPYAPESVTGRTVKTLGEPHFLSNEQQQAINRANALSLFPRFDRT